jgi:hypothetical protein
MQTNSAGAVQGIAVATAVNAGSAGTSFNHAEGIVVQTAIKAGEKPGLATNHAEGLVG